MKNHRIPISLRINRELAIITTVVFVRVKTKTTLLVGFPGENNKTFKLG